MLLSRAPKVDRLRLVRAAGIEVVDDAGNTYLDAASAVLVVNFGYADEELIATMADAARTISFAYERRAVTPVVEELADELVQLAPPGIDWVHLQTTGSDAIEAAMRLALWYQRGRGRPERWRVASLAHGYHGCTLGALQVSGRHAVSVAYDVTRLPSRHLPTPHCDRCPLGLERPGCGIRCADELATLLESPQGADVGAFLVEPILGNAAGAIVPPDGYLRRIREICDRFDVLLIVDEMITGLGRTGRMFAVEHEGVVPDVICTGKGLSGGYFPMSAVLVHERVVEALPDDTNLLGHTFSAHPVGCAVALQVLRRIREGDLVHAAAERGARLHAALDGLRGRKIVSAVRGRGLLAAVELGVDGQPFPPAMDVAARVQRAARANGLLVLPVHGGIDGTTGDHVTIAPPLVAGDADIDAIVARLDLALAQTTDDLAVLTR